MKRIFSLFIALFMAFVVFWSIKVFAADSVSAIDLGQWGGIIGMIINTAVVLLVVQLLKTWIPVLNLKVPWLLPIIAGAVGPAIASLQIWLSGLLGIGIDLSPIVAIFTGGSAVAAHQVSRQASKMMNKTACLFLLAPLLLAGCAGWQQNTTLGYVGTCLTITTAEKGIKPSCDQVIIPVEKCDKIKAAYNDVALSVKSAGDILCIALTTTDALQKENLLAQYQTISDQVQDALTNLITLIQQVKADATKTKLEIKMGPKKLGPAEIGLIVNGLLAVIEAIPKLIELIQSSGMSQEDIQVLVQQIRDAQASLPVWE